MSGVTKNASGIFAAVSGAITALGIMKTILETTSGDGSSLQKVAFYTGFSAVIVYFVLVVAVSVASAAAQSMADDGIVIFALIIGGVIGAGLVLSFDLVSFEDSGPIARTFGAVLGLLTVVGSVWVWNRIRNTEANRTP